MRTKEEILDTIDALGGECFRSETILNKDKGHLIAPGANFIEAMKPFAEAVLDLRDLLAPILADDCKALLEIVEALVKTKNADGRWRQDALGMVLKALGDPALSNLRKAASKLEREKTDDADADPEAAPGHGRTDSDPEEAGPRA